MKLKVEINPIYEGLRDVILEIPSRFKEEGSIIQQGRNLIKSIEVRGMESGNEGADNGGSGKERSGNERADNGGSGEERTGKLELNIKSFKVPHLINRVAYKYLRKSKAERSFKYALKLESLGIGTPTPVAYLIYSNALGVEHSYYISLQVECDYEFRDLRRVRPSDMEAILRAFTRFTYKLHQNGIYFVDHSPGNTLIKRDGDSYRFYLVDLNRIKFKEISTMLGVRNFARLNADSEMIEVIGDEYALLTNSDSATIINLLKKWTFAHDAHVKRGH